MQFIGEEGVGFDFDEHFGGDEPADFDHGAGGTDFAENLAVGTADFFPVGDMRNEEARADYVR